jgi:hypothetical protein
LPAIPEPPDDERPPAFRRRPLLVPHPLAASVARDEGSIAARVVIEGLGGLGFALIGALGGVALGCAAQCGETAFAPRSIAIGAMAGIILGLPTGIWVVGNGLDGEGNLGWTFLGSVAGWLTAGAGVMALRGLGDGGAAWVVLLPIAGGILGYEVSSANELDENAPRPAVSASIQPENGGIRVGLSGYF